MSVARVRLVHKVAEIAGPEWDALIRPLHPFARHAYFRALEASRSACAEAGWQPLHLVLEGPGGAPQGILPGYLKAHSRGEYVFDHGWAEAWERHVGGRGGPGYYPKLQHAVPFTPATAPRLLAPDPEARQQLARAGAAVAAKLRLSSAHATFLSNEEADMFRAAGWLERRDLQFHWLNPGAASFDEWLGLLSSRRRKTLRRERAQALAAVDEVLWLTGSELTEQVWDAFYAFYLDTSSRKWGRPYLTRDFFSMVGETMGEDVLLVMARRSGRFVAGAINYIGPDALYGRHWGAIEDIPFLHFELCYHQAIDFACRRGLARVEAGAQGPHKLSRGYEPVWTRSAHWLAEPGFRAAVEDFCRREAEMLDAERRGAREELPFRRDTPLGQALDEERP